jgi:hypothetical protein
MRDSSRWSRIKLVAFEHDRFKRFVSMKWEFIDFLNSTMIVEAISTGRTNSAIYGFLFGPNLLVSCCVEAISVNRSRPARSSMIDRYINQTYDHLWWSNVRAKLDITFCLNQEMKSGLPAPAPRETRVSCSCEVGSLDWCQNSQTNSLSERESMGLDAE